MRPDDGCLLTDPAQGTLKHLVGYRVGKHDQEIRRTDPVLHIRCRLAEYLRFTSVLPADIPILPFHTFISTKNYDTHGLAPLLMLVLSNLILLKTAAIHCGG
jgi:hypothetical protein